MSIEDVLLSIDSRLARLVELAELSDRRSLMAPPSTARWSAVADDVPEVQSDVPPEVIYRDAVKAALVEANQRLSGSGMRILRDVGGVKTLVELPEEKFAAVVAAAKEARQCDSRKG